MKTYWQSFLEEYSKKASEKQIHIVLEAFFYYCNNGKEKCNELMNS